MVAGTGLEPMTFGL